MVLFCSQTLIIFSLCKLSLSFVSLIIHQKASFPTIFPHHLWIKVGNNPQLNSEGLSGSAGHCFRRRLDWGENCRTAQNHLLFPQTFTTSVSQSQPQVLFDFLSRWCPQQMEKVEVNAVVGVSH